MYVYDKINYGYKKVKKKHEKMGLFNQKHLNWVKISKIYQK